MKALTITDLRRGKGPIWVLNQGIKRDRDLVARSYGEVVIEVRNPHPKIVKDIRKWAKIHRSSTERQEAVGDLGTWMHKRTTETGAHFVNGRAKNAGVVDLANDLVRKVENNEPLIEVRNMVLPQTWLPLCVTNEFKRKALLNTPAFIKAVKDGVLVPITEEDARAILERDGAEEELERLERQRTARTAVENVTMLVMDRARIDSCDPTIRSYHEAVTKARAERTSWPRQAFENMPPVIHGKAKTLRETPVEIVCADGLQETYEVRDRAAGMAEHPIEAKLEAETQAMEQRIVERVYPRPWWKRLLFWR